MKNILTSVLAFGFLFNLVSVKAQQTVCLGTDATVCAGNSITIQDCTPGSGNSTAIQLTAPTTVTLSDDQWSAAVPIGFTFNFYGVNYTQAVIGSNCILSFNLANAGGYCPWALGGVGPLPNAGFAAARNTVMPAYQDINPSAFASPGGAVQYQTLGTAPNRRFIVLWRDISSFGCNGNCNYIASILYETSNNIEVHIGQTPACPGWNGGLKIQGTENNAGTVAHITPGRNNTQWTANQDARRWTPTTPANTTNYTITQIPYSLVMSPNAALSWMNTLGNTYPYNGGNLLVNPVPAGTTGYFLVAGGACVGPGGAGAVSDTTWLTSVSSSVTASSVPDICSASQGSVTATPLTGVPPYTFLWPGLGGATTQTVNNVAAGTYSVTMTDGNGCSSTASVTVGDTPATFTGSTTVVSCPGGNDGTATATMTPVLGNVTYQWDDPMMQTTATAVGLAAGQYTCTVTSDIGCTGTVVVDVVEIPGMIGVIVNQQDVTCNSGDDGIVEVSVSQGTAPYTYSWDNSTSTTNIANDLMVGPHTVTVTDANGCVITISTVLGQPASLQITNVTPDTQICPEDEITLTVSGSGGSSPYTFTWTENGTVIGTGTSITVDPAVTNTQYCVTLSEQCGSPTDNECLVITFPTPIVPSATADEYEKCMPGRFEFTNTSTNSGEIATTLFEFGDGNMFIEVGADSTSHTYNKVGIFDLTITTTSIYGCVYKDTLFDFVEVKPNPIADFTFSSNPATIFETKVIMQDRSSFDVINWEWISPNSTPTTSAISKPTFVFPQEVGDYPVSLVVTTEHGCVDTVTFYLKVVQDILFFAPNAFTPDGDEHNQTWKPQIQGIDIYDFDLYIFNRWGEVIWENHDPNVGWDGTYKGRPVDAGMFTWRATVKNPYNDSRAEFNGSIHLLK